MFGVPSPEHEQMDPGMTPSKLEAMLSSATAGFSGADIASICQSVKMDALRSKLAGNPMKITTQNMLELIKTRRASITPELLDEYRRFVDEYGERK